MTAWQRYPPLSWRAEKAYFPVSLVMDKRLCQFACKVTYFFTHAQARERNIARFSVANVCVEGADWECLETKIRHNVPTKIRKNRGMCVFFLYLRGHLPCDLYAD